MGMLWTTIGLLVILHLSLFLSVYITLVCFIGTCILWTVLFKNQYCPSSGVNQSNNDGLHKIDDNLVRIEELEETENTEDKVTETKIDPTTSGIFSAELEASRSEPFIRFAKICDLNTKLIVHENLVAEKNVNTLSPKNKMENGPCGDVATSYCIIKVEESCFISKSTSSKMINDLTSASDSAVVVNDTKELLKIDDVERKSLVSNADEISRVITNDTEDYISVERAEKFQLPVENTKDQPVTLEGKSKEKSTALYQNTRSSIDIVENSRTEKMSGGLVENTAAIVNFVEKSILQLVDILKDTSKKDANVNEKTIVTPLQGTKEIPIEEDELFEKLNEGSLWCDEIIRNRYIALENVFNDSWLGTILQKRCNFYLFFSDELIRRQFMLVFIFSSFFIFASLKWWLKPNKYTEEFLTFLLCWVIFFLNELFAFVSIQHKEELYDAIKSHYGQTVQQRYNQLREMYEQDRKKMAEKHNQFISRFRDLVDIMNTMKTFPEPIVEALKAKGFTVTVRNRPVEENGEAAIQTDALKPTTDSDTQTPAADSEDAEVSNILSNPSVEPDSDAVQILGASETVKFKCHPMDFKEGEWEIVNKEP